MALSISSFTEWLENDCQWHWNMNIDKNGILTVTVVFDSSFPALPADYTWLADARLIAPSFRKSKVVRRINKKYADKGGYFAFQTPRWYPLPDGGWKILSIKGEADPKCGTLKEGAGKSVSWNPYPSEKFSSIIDKYTDDYGRYVIFAYNFLESGFDPSYPQAERDKLSERGNIRKQSLDIYLSVGISFIVRDNAGTDTCVARLFGIPKHFVSKDLL